MAVLSTSRRILTLPSVFLIVLLAGVPGCISVAPVDGPFVAGCVGGCDESYEKEVPVTTPGPYLQIKVADDSNLCSNHSARVVLKIGETLLSDKTYTLAEGNWQLGFVKPGDTDLVTGGVVRPGEVLSVSAQVFPNEDPSECKTKGDFRFEIVRLQLAP